jgi:hypothetical protein
MPEARVFLETYMLDLAMDPVSPAWISQESVGAIHVEMKGVLMGEAKMLWSVVKSIRGT